MKCKHETVTGFTKEGNLKCCNCGKEFKSNGTNNSIILGKDNTMSGVVHSIGRRVK